MLAAIFGATYAPAIRARQQVIHALGRFVLQLRRDMAVGVHGQANLTVPQDLHEHARMDSLNQ
jgi:hypothetical protein